MGAVRGTVSPDSLVQFGGGGGGGGEDASAPSPGTFWFLSDCSLTGLIHCDGGCCPRLQT